MKIMLVMAILLILPMLATADEHLQRRLLHIDLAEFPAHKVCIYKNELYSEGAEIKMESQKFYRCERYQEGKTTNQAIVQLRWGVVTHDKMGSSNTR